MTEARSHIATAMMATIVTLLLLGTGSSTARAEAPSWTGLRGETPADGELMKLGEDVLTTAGPPAGPPMSGQPLEDRTTALAATLRCPVCQSQSVQDSTSEAARNMRSHVQAMLAAGYDEDQIFLYFEHSYGEFIRLMPRAEGFNLLVWALPVGAILIGLVLVGLVVRRSMAHTKGVAAEGRQSPEESPLDRETQEAAGAAEGEAAPEVDVASDPSLQPWLDRVRNELAETDV